MRLNFDAIPRELQRLPRWVNWKVQTLPDGRITKVPCGADARPVSVTAPESWRTFEEARAVNGALMGKLGFVFSGDDDIAGIDLDKCVHDGDPESWAAEIVDSAVAADCYVERSPSGTGIHIIGRLSQPLARNRGDRIEIYERDRYFTVTGDVLHAPALLGSVDELLPLVNARMREGQDKAPPVSCRALDDDAYALALEKARAAADVDDRLDGLLKDDDEFVSLYPSRSEARIALLGLLRDSLLTVDEIAAVALGCDFGQHEQQRNKWPRLLGQEIGVVMVERSVTRDQAREVGDGTAEQDDLPEVVTLDQMRSEYVFITTGQCVVRRGSSFVYQYPDFKLRMRASKWMPVALPGAKPPRPVPVVELWMDDNKRRTVDVLTFAPGRDQVCTDPEGNKAYNLWTPVPHETPADWEQRAKPFLDHVEYLVPVQSERTLFLQWLAHIEQAPGQLPHFHYLMIASQTGIGRSWLACVLAYVFPRYTALGFDLPGTLRTGFNGRLSRKLLATVEELHEAGGRVDQYRHSESLKTLLTEPHRYVNPKYGKQYVEFNACRFLMFSNHDAALVLADNDRRVNVIENPRTRMATSYYTELYRLVGDAVFTASVREALRRTDLSDFNPGMLAVSNAAKDKVLYMSKSDLERALADFLDEWPSDAVPVSAMRIALESSGLQPSLDGASLRHALSRAGLCPCKYQFTVGYDDKKHKIRDRVWLRSSAWALAPHDAIAAELRRGWEAWREKHSEGKWKF